MKIRLRITPAKINFTYAFPDRFVSFRRRAREMISRELNWKRRYRAATRYVTIVVRINGYSFILISIPCYQSCDKIEVKLIGSNSVRWKFGGQVSNLPNRRHSLNSLNIYHPLVLNSQLWNACASRSLIKEIQYTHLRIIDVKQSQEILSQKQHSNPQHDVMYDSFEWYTHSAMKSYSES